MESWLIAVITGIVSIVASSGFWAWLTRKTDKKSAMTDMIIGLGHDRIIFLGMSYIERGWITGDEYENLHDYLYAPYEKLGGNGSAKKIMAEVNKLEIRRETKPIV